MSPAARPLTLTVIVPAHNEEQGLPATLEALLRQTVPAEEIVVIDDGSTDRTGEVAREFGVTVLRPPQNLGSKAKAQNYALPFCSTDLVLAVDADTVLADDYIENIKPAFDDEEVLIASGCVQSRFERTWAERGRSVEYLYGFHWNRPIENMANSPVVCSGCCSVFRRQPLVDFGGFPERTIVEDMDYTWSIQMAGKKAVYVSSAVAWAADPEDLTYLRKQTWRWAAGYFQNVRIHLPRMIVKKPMLAFWVALKLWETIAVPLWLLLPMVVPNAGFSVGDAFVWWFLWWLSTSTLMIGLPLVYAAKKRNIPLRRVLRNLPYVFLTKLVDFCYQWKAMVVELVLVPLRLSKGVHQYEKGRADTPAAIPAPQVPAEVEAGGTATAIAP